MTKYKNRHPPSKRLSENYDLTHHNSKTLSPAILPKSKVGLEESPRRSLRRKVRQYAKSSIQQRFQNHAGHCKTITSI